MISYYLLGFTMYLQRHMIILSTNCSHSQVIKQHVWSCMKMSQILVELHVGS